MNADGINGDRNDIFLQKGGDLLIQQVADGCGAGQSSTIVVIHSVGPVILDKWINHPGVKAVIMANLPGQESGNAIKDILLGNANPSGKLPYTIGKSLDDYGPGAKVLYYPNGAVPQQDFSEGLYIDYRHFDKYDVDPTYEFGFGLSYPPLTIPTSSSRLFFPNLHFLPSDQVLCRLLSLTTSSRTQAPLSCPQDLKSSANLSTPTSTRSPTSSKANIHTRKDMTSSKFLLKPVEMRVETPIYGTSTPLCLWILRTQGR